MMICEHGADPFNCSECMRDDLTALRAEVRRLRAALRFYADRDHYSTAVTCGVLVNIAPDGGETARRVLAKRGKK